MEPVDVNPLRTDPATITNPDRRRVHAARCDAQHNADRARSALIAHLTDAGTPAYFAVHMVDTVIMAVRTADAMRLEYARSTVYDRWPGIGDLNGAVDFLSATAHAFPVQSATT